MTLPIGVAEYYAGKSIFITGATGFMGIILVEKLLRSCPDIKNLYLLIRMKKSMSVEDRLQNFLNNEVFNKVHAECPQNIHKLRLVSGDMRDDQLGISPIDQEELRRECQIIFHCAASVRFDMFIRDAVEINVNGSEKILKFAETMNKLEVFLYVSTAYCHDYLDLLEEKLYPPKHNPQEVMQIVKWMDDDILKTIENKLIHPLPNTYAYTKNLAEEVVAQYAGKFTIAIARPSIIIAAHQEPIPGWINNVNGPTGLLIAGAKGVFRVMYTRENVKPDIIPVDIAVNACILLAYTTALQQPKEIRICNVTNSGLNTKSWAEMSQIWNEAIKNYPFSVCLWYPKIVYYRIKVLYQVHALFVHWLPALLIDMLLTITRKKPFLLNVQKRLHHGLQLLEHYMTGDWVFKNDNFFSLRNLISKKEREIFFTEYENIDQDQYTKNYILGTRRYCCNDLPSTLPKAKRQFKFLYYLHVFFYFIFIWLFLNIIYYFYTNFF